MQATEAWLADARGECVRLGLQYSDVDIEALGASPPGGRAGGRHWRVDGVRVDGECGICMEDGKLRGIGCGHNFCASCWQMYIDQQIMSGG